MSLAQVNLLASAVARRDAAADLRSLRNLAAVTSAAQSSDGHAQRALDQLWDELRVSCSS
jgi:hypothetical protein